MTASASAVGPSAFTALRRRLGEGELGLLPVVVGLALVWAIFTYLNPNFLTPRNLTNLVLQSAAMGTLSVGVVLVLLLGEIDLSVGAVSGLCAAVTGVLSAVHGVPAPLAIGAGLLAGLAIGLAHGAFFTRFGVPSFVVTLAGLLAWQGALLLVLGPTGSLNLTDPAIGALTGAFLPGTAGWLCGAALAGFYGLELALRQRRRQAAELDAMSSRDLLARLGAATALILGTVGILNADRGVPLAFVILLGLVIGFDRLTRRTRFGRHLYAVGGNAEAARRAGISVMAIRIAVFGLTGALAACGGILAASRLRAVNQSSGTGDVLLNAIAAAVIGGTSLFGGRGNAWAALAGALVIGSISNGMDLLALASSIKFIVTGGVMLAAVTIDAIARQGRQTAGRA